MKGPHWVKLVPAVTHDCIHEVIQNEARPECGSNQAARADLHPLKRGCHRDHLRGRYRSMTEA